MNLQHLYTCRESEKRRKSTLSFLPQKFFLFFFIILISSFFYISVYAEPASPTITVVSNSSRNTSTSTARTDTKGYIYTTRFTVTQQSSKWKAYVGNISGSISLSDAQNYSIYQWTSTPSSGNVFATRSSAIDWTTVYCANATNITAEQTDLNHGTGSQTDILSNTYQITNTHPGFSAGPTQFAANSCNYTLIPFINGSDQSGAALVNFTNIALVDKSTDNLVYVGLGNTTANVMGYDGNFWDFQLIIPDSGLATSLQYYFYAEII